MRLASSLRRAVHAIIMGPPGSGKGTVSSRIVRDFDMRHLSSGDLLRAEIASKSACGIEAEKYITTGKLAPDTLMVDLILSQLQKLPSGTNWLLDGFPRSLGQAESLSEKEKVDFVINLDVPFDTICERLSGRWTHLPSGRVYNVGFNPPKVAGIDDITGEPLVQREDDKIETVHKRLQTYQTQTLPLLEFYRKRNILHSYSGTKTDEIWPNVKAFLETILVDPKQRRHA
ncbi:GTP:AMP phosphotransferase AK3, mitochondrial-like isoform X1 [Clavelina lepadiformis]|uniref:GTP:AMP phosphotransferase, mitochondrial n=1 Tax=Clavelina lepadiformis TaxID=159417 RepID=A0ABP0GCQ3_CLALP